MATILDRIVAHKKKEVASDKRLYSLALLRQHPAVLKPKAACFARALRGKKPVAVIAELKPKSPSKGVLRKNFDPAGIARQYERAGASALSVLTDRKFFGGSIANLQAARRAAKLPILRKDFTIDVYQIYQAKLIGADAILLIASLLSRRKLAQFYKAASQLGLDVLFEVHTLPELKKVLPLKPKLIGINNRNLKDFSVDLSRTGRLADRIPPSVTLVSESGIQSRGDLLYLNAHGADAVLVGESLMRQASPGQALIKLLKG